MKYTSLTKDQLKWVEESGLDILKERVYPEFKDGRITPPSLYRMHDLVFGQFDYKSDDFMFDESDFWDTQAFDKFAWNMIKEGTKFQDDCDGFGYAMIEFLVRMGVKKSDICMGAVMTETGEGHFVALVHTSEGWLQTENRTHHPRPTNYFKALGYQYNYLRRLNTKTWKPASNNIEEFTNTHSSAEKGSLIHSIPHIKKSKTLMASASQIALAGIGMVTAVAEHADWKTIAMLAVLGASGVAFYYLRLVTYKPVLH